MRSRLFLAALTGLLAAPLPAADSKTVKVFILAGQSNMEGQAVVDLAGKDYNEGKGTLATLLNEPAFAARFGHLRDDRGQWAVRDDVWVRYQRERQQLLAGPLGVGFGAYAGRHHFGPELQFGHVLGDALDEPVLLLKTAWGGKSLYKDFRPPSSGGEVGIYYTLMIQQVRAALTNLATEFPALAGHRPELAGFVWYHGWNDGVDPKNAVPEYEANLVNLIRDVRREFHTPQLPVVIGELTGPWVNAPPEWEALRQAQSAAAARPELGGNVAFVETRNFVRRSEDSPNPTHGHHEFGNAETYALVGDALGRAMKALLPAAASVSAPMPQAAGPTPRLVLPGLEQFTVAGRPAFVFLPPAELRAVPQPWIFYAPTLPAYPDGAERWMHERFLAAGIAVAGVDVGEAYGSPQSHATFDALFQELTEQRGFATRACLFGRSRGGLWVSSWAIAHPERVAGIIGIYPVFDFRTYPGLEKAAPAYGLTPAELATRTAEFNPIARVSTLARARVPVALIHGDMDQVVPLTENSGEFARVYREAGVGSLVKLIVLEGQGHNFFEGFFQSAELVDFAIARARAGAAR